MSLAPAPTRLLTADEFLALPDDGTDRWLVRGEIWPREAAVMVRNRKHGEVEAKISYLLIRWLEGQPEPRGKIHSGEAGFRIRVNPDTMVGIDVAYASPELVARTTEGLAYYDGPPTLAVEILSPTDKHEEIVARVTLLLGSGVALVWVVDPDFRIVGVHRPGWEPEAFNVRQELPADPSLPGLRVAVSEIFA